MAEITTQEVSYRGKAGNLKAYVAHSAGSGSLPVVIVVQEWWGLNENIKDIARRFANERYFAIAPDLYSRQGNKVASDPNTAAELMGGLKTPDGIDDLQSTIDWIRGQKETAAAKIGITGYCMGGSYATLLPCESKEISAAAPFYGEIPSDDKIKNLHCPIFTPTALTTDGSSAPTLSGWRPASRSSASRARQKSTKDAITDSSTTRAKMSTRPTRPKTHGIAR